VSLSTTTALKARAESVFATTPRKPPHEETSGQKLIRRAEIEVEEKIARLRALRETALANTHQPIKNAAGVVAALSCKSQDSI
jgi:hypothetical protein